MKSQYKYLHEILYLLGEDRRKLPWMILLFLSVSMLDLAGIGLIAPYAGLVVNSDSLIERYGDVLIMLGLPLEQKPLLLIIGVGLLCVFLMKTITGVYVNLRIVRFAQNQQVRLRSFLMQSYLYMPYSKYLTRNSADYIYSVQTLSGQYANSVVFSGLKMLSDGIIAVAVLLLLLWANGLALGVLAFMFGVAALFYDRLFRSKLGLYGRKSNEASTKMIRGIHEGVEGLKEIRILGKKAHFYQIVRNGAIECAHYNVKTQMISFTPRYFLELLMVSFIVMLVMGTLLLGQNVQEIVPLLAMFGVAALRLVPATNTYISGLIQLRFHRNTVSRLYADLISIKETGSEPESLGMEPKAESTFRELRLDSVGFHYPEATQQALNGVSLKIHAGESIGLIGPSGSGKTTLLDVLLGLLEPQEGRLFYNGSSLKETINDWRSNVAYLPQQVFLIDNTLRKNVALGMDDDEIDDSRLLEALRQARLSEVVEQLPQGVDTLLGERGVRLSGGQRQRVALARAFYHGRNVLVMDEATSALDGETEKEIVEEIKLLKGTKTMIVIAHRLNTVQHCDRIYSLAKGTIVAEGTPHEILN